MTQVDGEGRSVSDIPTGTVTFAFTDIEGSTERWERDRSAMEAAVRRHDALVREAIARHQGYAFKAAGDSFCAAFSQPADAVAAMLDAQRSLAAEDFSAVGGLRVRAAVHTGTADERNGDYFGPAVNRVARLMDIGHGGQILISGVTGALARADLPPQTTLRDLGEHRLKDLTAREHVYQLASPDLPSEFPPLRSLGTHATNLPVQLTSFVGREHEISEITALVRDNRLVTLIGSGGVGKTRTALQVAANLLHDFGDGVWFVDLAPLSNGDHIPSTVAHAVGFALAAGDDPIVELVRALKSKKALLLFDNCEHLVEPVAGVILATLEACPNVKILASSRQSLDISGEQTYRLPSLDVPAAVALFADRARSVDERFALTGESAATVAEICDRLDGIPLAIELAASRTAVLSAKQLSEKLNERFRLLSQKSSSRLPRQQTLRALIDWSFDLLDEDERKVFRRLSIFAGGWTLQAASAVCSDDAIDEWQVFELLSALVSKSLVVAEPSGDDRRYHLLNSIREYSRERMEVAGEAAGIANKHAGYFAAFAGSLAPLVDALEDVQWQRALSPELDNLRAALNWTIFRVNDASTGLRLLAQLEWPELLTTPQEAVQWFDAAEGPLDAATDEVTRARVLRHHVRLEWLVGRATAEREKRANSGLAVARSSADPNETAHALAILGSVYRDAGRFDDAERLFEEAYAAAPALSPITLNALLRNWAVTNLQRGDVETARRRFAEVAERERPGSEAHASALLNIGELEFAVGNVEAARTAARKARETLDRLNAAPLGLAVCNLAAYAMAVDELAEARELLREALTLLKQTGARWMVTALEHHALLGELLGDHDRAATLVGFTNARYAGADVRQRTERIGYERLMRLLSVTFADEELSRRLSAGASLSDEQALEHAAAINEPQPSSPAAAAVEKRD
jgi:predicted ATPase/class 3 adenylate cyclase